MKPTEIAELNFTDEQLVHMQQNDGVLEFNYLALQLGSAKEPLLPEVQGLIDAVSNAITSNAVEPNMLLNVLTQSTTFIVYLLLNKNNPDLTEQQIINGQEHIIASLSNSLPELMAVHNREMPIYETFIEGLIDAKDVRLTLADIAVSDPTQH